MNKILLICIILLLFSGCSKKGDSKPNQEANFKVLLVGNWSLQKDTSYHYDENNKVIGTFSLDKGDILYQFFADGTGNQYNRTSGSIDPVNPWKFSWTVSEKTLTFKFPAQTVGNVSYGDFSDTVDILSVDGTLLHFRNYDASNASSSTDHYESAEYYTKIK